MSSNRTSGRAWPQKTLLVRGMVMRARRWKAHCRYRRGQKVLPLSHRIEQTSDTVINSSDLACLIASGFESCEAACILHIVTHFVMFKIASASCALYALLGP